MHKIIRVENKNYWQEKNLEKLLSEGWKVKSSTSQPQGYSCGKTCCFGGLFLPLALLGRKPNDIEYVLEKEDDEKEKK